MFDQKGDIDKLKAELNRLNAENNTFKKSLNRLQVIADSSFEGIFIHDNGVLIDMNGEFVKIFGYSRDELIGQNMIKLLFPSEYHQKLKERIKSNYSEPFELQAIRKDRSVFYVEIEGREIELGGEIIRATSVRNITKRKEAEKAFIEEKYFSDKVLNSLPGIFYLYKLIDRKFRLVRWNKNHELFTGFSSADLSNKLVSDFFTKEEYPKILIEIEKVFVTGAGKVEGNLKLKNNKTVPYLLEGYAFTDDGDSYFMGVGVDISHQKELEKKILQSIVETEENERTRFSIDLHDGLSPLLSTCKIYAEAIELAKTDRRKFQALEMLNNTLDEAILHMHEISNNISPHILRNYGIETAVKSFYENLEDITNINFHFKTNIEKRLKLNMETSLYRIIIELINNTAKYAGAQNINIDISRKNNSLFLNYTDDGVGFDTDKELLAPSGMGLNNIANRVKSLNGSFTLKSEKNIGMELLVEIKEHKN